MKRISGFSGSPVIPYLAALLVALLVLATVAFVHVSETGVSPFLFGYHSVDLIASITMGHR